MGRANIRSGDEPVKYLMVNSMTVNLDMLGMFIKIEIAGKKDCSLVITIHGHDPYTGKIISKRKEHTQSISEEPCIIACYLASALERETICCFLLRHVTRFQPTNVQYSEIDF